MCGFSTKTFRPFIPPRNIILIYSTLFIMTNELFRAEETLTRVDKSKKGEIDAGILDLVNLINSKDSYYTTSSCSGRIILIQKKSAKKFDCEWILVSHDQIKLEDVKKALHEPLDAKVWFRQEPMILHVACKTIDDAKRFLAGLQARRHNIAQRKNNCRTDRL